MLDSGPPPEACSKPDPQNDVMILTRKVLHPLTRQKMPIPSSNIFLLKQKGKFSTVNLRSKKKETHCKVTRNGSIRIAGNAECFQEPIRRKEIKL